MTTKDKSSRQINEKMQARLGQPKLCSQCLKYKAIGPKNWFPKKSTDDGCRGICITCHNKNANMARKSGAEKRMTPTETTVQKRAAGRPKGTKALRVDSTVLDRFRNDPRKPRFNRTKFLEEVAEINRQLIENSATGRPVSPDFNNVDQERKYLKGLLTAVTRMVGDPAGHGEITDQRLCFDAFIEIIKPTIAGWRAFGAVHEDIIASLMSDHPAKVCLASRGTGKSVLTTIYVTWCLWRDPVNEQVLVVSQGEKHAKNFVRAVRDYISLAPLLSALEPDKEQIDNALELVVGPAKGIARMAPSLRANGITGQITGGRARLIIGDDCETTGHDTVEAVDKLYELIQEFDSINGPFPNAQTIFLGTPQSQFSLYGRLARSDHWETYRAVIFEEDRLDGRVVISSRWPDSFPDHKLTEKKARMSQRAWNLQYALDLSETKADQQPLMLKDLPVITWPQHSHYGPLSFTNVPTDVSFDLPRGSSPENDKWYLASYDHHDTKPYIQTVAAIDPSSGLQGRDAIGVAILSITAGGFGIIRTLRGIRSDDRKQSIAEVARLLADYKVTKALVESYAGGFWADGLSLALQQISYPITLDTVKSGGVSKSKRVIEAITSGTTHGKLAICAGALQHPDGVDFVNQYTGIRESKRGPKHDDIVDALAYAVAEVVPVLTADEAAYIAGARHSFQDYVHMPRRLCALNEEELEMWVSHDEAYEYNQEQISRLRTIKANIVSDLDAGRGGPHDIEQVERLDRQIEELRRMIVRPDDHLYQSYQAEMRSYSPTPEQENIGTPDRYSFAH